MNARRAPEGVGEGHGADEVGKLQTDGRTTQALALRSPGPEGAKAQPMPAYDRLGANDVKRSAPACPSLREPHPEQAIEAAELRTPRSAAEQGELLPERQVLEREVGSGSERRA